MTDDHDSAEDARQQSLPARWLAALHPRRHKSGLLIFAVALALGVMASLIWMHRHPAQPSPAAADARAPTADPTHPPLPTPMPGGLSSLPAQIASGPNAAYIQSAPAAAPAENASTVAPNQTTVADTAQVEELPDNSASSSSGAGPQLIHRTQPEYPIEALRAHEEGSVQMEVTLDTSGNVINAYVSHSSRSRALDRAALDAVRSWQFRPTIQDGQRVQSTVTETVDFHLNGN